ncbi:LysM peptidoglycan-binding domain-containing protein [Mesorhizobium muleiense]|uniref:LysM peptidoglycan-binding domain-containing protein n=1 Tax=Mesorhizobium muleiense TaxID=1004279 RepID=UPI001F210578|nr:LysM peptidoglycan-binding domain-containing protein [Mesorhizobium muleiense]MCF6118253.1 LysM peptidoglycan-binding domain-containing protein [Mesorhizobium muleiense]
MIRPINTVKPPPPPRVDPKANAEQTTRLQAEATKLQNEIRLANRMGEADAAAGARQRLTQVNADLAAAQPTAPAPQQTTQSPQRTAPAQPGPELPAAVTTANGNGGATAALALFTMQDSGGAPNLLLASGGPDNVSPEVKANDILKAIDGGKSIDNIAAEQGLAPEDVVAALNAGGMTAVATEHANGDTRTVVITAGDRTITENQDYQHGGYYTQETGPDMQAMSSPIRDDLGRKETTSIDAQTGAITTTLVDDLGDGAVTERTTNPQTRETTTTETSGDGAVTVTSNLPNGSTVQTVTPAGGPALPVTTVTAPDGEVTTLAQSQTADGSGVPAIQEQLAAGKSIEEIAEASDLTPEQVIAELNAAGLEVTQGGDPGETLQIVVTDPETGKTVTYSNDYQHGSTSVTTIEGNTETTDTVDGNGRTSHTERNTETGEQTTTIVDPKNNTETTIVVDKDGRRTETIVETLNDGEPIDYEVQPGDNLSDIAEAHGVTLEDLAESNPELFTSPRDPDLIHPGETVVIDGATRTTVNVTFNGYTVTENPDGTVTVANQEHGYEIEVEAGSLEADLAELLTDVNPNSSDPREAREAETVLNTLDGIFASEAIQQEGAGLDLEAVEGLGEVSAAAREVVEEHGPGIPAEPVMDQDGEVLDLYGERPEAAGADWVPIDWQGAVRWVHPDVAQALLADSETLATISELSAVIDASNAQSDVYALDSDHAGAQVAAEDTLNGVLNPHGYAIDFEKPKGTLEEAREALTAAQTVLDDATEVRSTYEEASSALDAAIEANRELDPLVAAPDPNAPEATAEDSNIHTDVYQQEEYAGSRAEHAEVEAMFGEYNRLIAEGDLGSIDLAIVRNEQAGVDTQSPDHQNLLGLRDMAQNRVELGQTYADYLRAESDLRGFEAESARMVREMFDEWLEDNSSGGDDMYARAYVTADGQAMIDVYYDRGHYVEEYDIDRPMSHHSRHGQSIRLSVFDQDLNPEVSRNPPGSWVDESLNDAWNEHVATGVPEGKSLNTAWNEHPEGIPEEYEIHTHGETFIAARENAAADLNELMASNAETALGTLNEGLSAVRSQFESDLAEHGPGTTELPDGAFPDGVEPVSVEWQGQTIMVSPEVKEQLEAGNLDAVIESGTPIQVQIDVTPDDDEYNPESRWVTPELALSSLDLAAVNTEIGNLEVFRDQMNGIAAGQRDNAENTHNYYMPNAVQDERLENDKQNVLDADFQSQFQSFHQNGFDGSFHTREGDALEQTIQDSLGLDAENEDHADILESVAEGIREFGGDAPEVSAIPIFYVDENGTSQTMLFGVRNDEGEIGYVDITGKRYADIEDFRHNNEQFSDDGRIVYAKNLDMTPGEDGRIEIDAQQARVLSAWESTIDPIVGIGTGVATILSFTPAAPIAAPIALAGAAYLGTRAAINQHEHISRGGEWTDTQSIMNVVSIATTVLPLGSSAMRLGGLVRAGVPRGTAFMASIGGTRTTNTYADDIAQYMRSGATSNRIAYGIDATTVAAAVPLVGVSGYDMVVNGGDMNGLQLASSMINFGAGAFGTGMGIRGLSVRPGSGQTGTGSHGQNPQQGADGPVPDGVVPPPGNTTGRLAIAAGDSGRPMVIHEQGHDGVYRPTDKTVFHDPDHPVIEGTVTNVHDEGPSATGERGDPENATDRGAQEAREQNATRPADGDPIIVPNEPTATDGPMRLVWDPQTRSFTGMPEPDTSGYAYSSGKDPKTPSAYLDGLTSEQLLARYEAEKSYYSSRELAERYGPDGVQIPGTPLRDILPDFRIGVTIRTRLNTGEYFDIGSPTVAAAGVGIGTKTDFGMIGWSVVDSISQRSMTPFKDALYTHGVVSYRAREYRNITGLQAGVWPVSNQTALPVRGSDLSAAASKAIFSDSTGYNVRPLDAAIVGMTPDGEGTVIEMTYTPSLEAKDATLVAGQHDFFGVPAENSTGHVELEGALPFDRVMTEFKAGLRLPIVANHVGAVDQMPRLGFEKRPELPVKDTLQPGDIVSRQTYDQIQSALGSTNLKIQFAVKDPAKASELIAAIGQGDGIASIRDLVKSGQIDPSDTVSFVDEPTLSGLRLSAVPGKAPTADIVLLTGEKARVANSEAMLVDVIFNDRNQLPGVLGLNPDRMATSAAYKVKSTVQSWLPARFTPEGTPQSRYMPSAGNIYRNLYGADGTPATRYTLSLSTPPLPAGAVAFSAEVRIQYKSNAAKVAPSIARNETATLAFDRADGQNETLTVPAWLARAVETSRDGAATGIPKGAKASLDQFLSELGTTARPDQRAAIEQFRTEFGPSVVDGGFMRQNVADGVLTFLSSQVGSRRSGPMQLRDENGQSVTATRYGPLPPSAENVYVPPADAPSARGDEPELMHKSHILFRDPETGEHYVLPWTRGASQDHVPGGPGRPEGDAVPPQATPARKAIEAAPPTTHSLQQVRNMQQPEKWKAGELYTRELNGSAGQAHFPVAADPTGAHPVFGEGGRYVDAPVFKSQDTIEAIEVKTYNRWTTIDGDAQMREVGLTPALQEQINKDVALRNANPGYQPRWVFIDAPPSAQLQRALDDAAIIGNIFGQKNPAAGKPQPVSSGIASGRTMRLQGKDGEVIVAAVLGTQPIGPEQVYVPPSDGPRAPADAPEVADKTHILVSDPNTGEAVVMPWIRGASDDHVSGSLGHPEDGNPPVEGAGDPARPLRGNVGPYVFRADTRAPNEIRDAGGFSPPPPTGIWVDNPQGIDLSNYVLGNTHGRFVGTSHSISGAKAFVSEESRAARQQGHTYLYTLNPSRPRLHVPTEFQAMGRPVSDSMARVDETAIDGSVPWNEVHGWRMMDPDGNFVGEFTRNEDAVAPGGSTQKRPQVILRPADEFWDATTQAEAPPPPVAAVVGNEAPAVAGETPPTENIAAETPTAATWPPAPDRGRVVFDPASGKIISLELPASSAAEPGFAEPVRAPTGPEVRALAADQIAELTATQLHAIKPEQIAKLAPEQVAALSAEQVRQLTFDQLAALRPTQLRALGGEQLQAIRPSKLQAVAPGRITGLRPDQVAAFSQKQLAGLTIEQVRKLTPDQIAKLSDEQRNALTPEQVAAMRPAQFSHLNATQFAALDPALVAARDPATMAKLSPRHIAALTREQLDALTIHQIEALTKQQIAALTPKQLGELSPGQLRKFTPRQFTWMSTEQTNALSVLQLTTYRATHKKVMTPDEAAAVDQALTLARLKENAQLVATFGSMAASSNAVWQILPPHWAATAAGVAFGVRGGVFIAQSAFPNATANHKPLGRALNAASGASFVFSSPGSAAGLLHGDKVWLNGSFSLGNVIYGTKSALQSVAGRPVLRNVAEHLGGPAYLFGSVLYTAQNLHSPLAATAGALFTVGSAEFWVSAARTDLLNRRAVPRTPEQIDARAKSDARWGIADRVALGVTFGVGMLLFAWDTLDDQPWNNTGKTPATDPTEPGDAPSGVDGAPPDEQTPPGNDPSGVDSAPPDEQTEQPDPGTETPPQDFPQLAVVADDGLNLRTQPDADSTVVTVLQPGTVVEQTAGPSADQSGDAWIPVEGFGPDGEMHSGWVSGDHVEAHADGSSNPAGRTNPTLEQDGYQWVEVKNGDSIRLIARTHSADVAETVVLNMDHILSPDVIFSGDRIYLPATLVG